MARRLSWETSEYSLNCLRTWFRRHKALCPGCRMMECSHDILDVEPSHDRNPHQPHRLPAPVPRRRRLRPVARRRPMAERLPVSRLRPRPRVGAEDQAAQLRVRLLPSPNLGHRRRRTKLSLAIWFRAACLMATHCNGISALQLQKRLGVGSCRSAWMLAAKLRRAMATPRAQPAVRSGRDRRGQSAAARRLGTATGPMSSATGPPVKFSPGFTPCFPTSRAGLGASATGCAPSASRPVSTSSSFASIGAEIATLPPCPCSCRLCAPSLTPAAS